ncbi:Rab GTPase [Tieghemostelium lacteum]|uniref:Rab GTPase n=1 Tax=Tieghemostelium lacteum TaxID=361077 RepID=A0A152A3E9_TIELA|nr:Rab GTPase [Tieghemostelium lacteum]|eukprot:KYR00792.1 Rab GTPase [Tieghemostelium lacteum]
MLCLLYDITSSSSFENLCIQFLPLLGAMINFEDLQLIFIGTKIDHSDKREVSVEEVESFISKNYSGALHFEISNKNGEGIEKLKEKIEYIAREKYEALYKEIDIKRAERFLTKGISH